MRIPVAIAIACAAGCAPDFDEYNQVLDFRVLALRATPPQLQPDETTAVDALVSDPDATYQWSWCPVAGEGAECAITEDELRALVAEAGADPSEIPGYDLGTGATAEFTHAIPPVLLAGICAAIADAELPEGVPRPSCDGSFGVTIRADVSDGVETITSVTELGLIYEDGLVANTNPAILGSEIFLVGGDVRMPMGGDELPVVARDAEYTLELDVSEADAELYEELEDGERVTSRERLTVTWFFEVGEMDKTRSSFIEGVTDLVNLRQNQWTAPLSTDPEPVDTNRFYFVLRDDRGGVDFTSGEVGLR